MRHIDIRCINEKNFLLDQAQFSLSFRTLLYNSKLDYLTLYISCEEQIINQSGYFVKYLSEVYLLIALLEK